MHDKPIHPSNARRLADDAEVTLTHTRRCGVGTGRRLIAAVRSLADQLETERRERIDPAHYADLVATHNGLLDVISDLGVSIVGTAGGNAWEWRYRRRRGTATSIPLAAALALGVPLPLDAALKDGVLAAMQAFPTMQSGGLTVTFAGGSLSGLAEIDTCTLALYDAAKTCILSVTGYNDLRDAWRDLAAALRR